MKSERGSGHRIFKTCMFLGFLLGIVLLLQSISTYVDVSGTVTSQAAVRSRDVHPAVSRTLVDTHPSSNTHARPVRMELSAYFENVADSIQSLRHNLIVGLSASIALMGALLVLVLRFPRYVRGQHVQGQVELARQVQADLLPPRDIESSHFEFAAECIPAGDVGGDFCDAFRIGGERTAFVLGDVSGKGISAALLMALIHGAIQSTSWTRSTGDHEDATGRLNTLLCRKTSPERFSTLFWGYYDPATSGLRYINAGHLPPLLIRMGEFGNLEVHRLEEGGPVLGVVPDARYTQGHVEIRKGDLLVAFSDGILETANSEGEEFGERRLIDAIRSGWKDSAGSIRNAVLERVKTFANQRTAHDDQTLLAVRFKRAAIHPMLVAVPGEKCGLVAQ